MFANCSENQNEVLKLVRCLALPNTGNFARKKIPFGQGNTRTLKCSIHKVPTAARGPPPPQGSRWQVHNSHHIFCVTVSLLILCYRLGLLLILCESQTSSWKMEIKCVRLKHCFIVNIIHVIHCKYFSRHLLAVQPNISRYLILSVIMGFITNRRSIVYNLL